MRQLFSSVLTQVEQAPLGPGKEELDILRLDLVDVLVHPLGALVFVDQEGPNTLIELSVVHVTLADPILHLEDVLHVHLRASFDLLKDDC